MAEAANHWRNPMPEQKQEQRKQHKEESLSPQLEEERRARNVPPHDQNATDRETKAEESQNQSRPTE